MKYKEWKEKTIYNGDTTIVYGMGNLSKSLVNKLYKDLGALYFEMDDFSYSAPIYVKGVTHRDDKDTYDKTMGVKVASRKAELKARIKNYNRLVRMNNKLLELQQLVEDELFSESRRIHALQEELDEIRRQ